MLALERGLRVLGQVGPKGGLDTNAGVGKWLRVLGLVGPKGGLDTTLRTLAVGSKSIGLKRQSSPDIHVHNRIQ